MSVVASAVPDGFQLVNQARGGSGSAPSFAPASRPGPRADAAAPAPGIEPPGLRFSVLPSGGALPDRRAVDWLPPRIRSPRRSPNRKSARGAISSRVWPVQYEHGQEKIRHSSASFAYAATTRLAWLWHICQRFATSPFAVVRFGRHYITVSQAALRCGHVVTVLSRCSGVRLPAGGLRGPKLAVARRSSVSAARPAGVAR